MCFLIDSKLIEEDYIIKYFSESYNTISLLKIYNRMNVWITQKSKKDNFDDSTIECRNSTIYVSQKKLCSRLNRNCANKKKIKPVLNG